MRRLVTILALLCCFLTVAAQGRSADDCARLAARGDVAELRPLYDSLQSQLPEYVDVYCRFAFSRAQREDSTTIALLDTLEAKYEDKFDVRGLLALTDVKCETLLRMGLYDSLLDYCANRLSWCQRRSIKQSRRKHLQQYHAIAHTLCEARTGAPAVQWVERESVVPASRDWPVLLPVTIGDKAPVPFLLGDERWTFISKNDAEAYGLPLLGPPLTIETLHGAATVRPAVVSALIIGGLVLHDCLVMVVDSGLQPPYDRAVGLDVMERFQSVTISDDCLRLSADGPVSWDDESSRNSADYRPMSVADYLAAGDIFGLLRNEASLLFTATDGEAARMTEVLDAALAPISSAADETTSPAESASPTIPEDWHPYLLLNTPQGLAYERYDGTHYRTIVVTDKIKQHSVIDTKNKIIYVP